jgi:DNA-binding XRE family transcriptional regulator
MGFTISMLAKAEQEELMKIYEQIAQSDPLLDEQAFLRSVITDWLRLGRVKEPLRLPKKQVRLCNNIRGALQQIGLQQQTLARSIGIGKSYLSQVISGEYELSMKMGLLILDAMRWPTGRSGDVFWIQAKE